VIPDRTEEQSVAFTTDVEMERTDHLGDDRILFELAFKVRGHEELQISATLETEFFEHPIVTASTNTIGLHPKDEDSLVLAIYNEMRRYFHGGPSGGDIWCPPVHPRSLR
jgi:hypothetical protein